MKSAGICFEINLSLVVYLVKEVLFDFTGSALPTGKLVFFYIAIQNDYPSCIEVLKTALSK